jgi:opine dehydrogenase
MRLGIVGAGPIGVGSAMLAQSFGHSAILCSPSGSLNKKYHHKMQAAGALQGTFPLAIATDAEAAVSGSDAVMFAVPPNAHRLMIDSVVGHLRASQLLILWAQSSLSAMYLSKRLAQRGLAAPIAIWSRPLIMARRTGHHQVTISAIRPRIEVAALPERAGIEVFARCVAMFGARFAVSRGIDVVLSNVSPVMHLPQALCNLTRIERGEAWSVLGNTTATVARLIEALDGERLQVATALGADVLSVSEFLHSSFPGLPLTSMAEQAPILAGRLPAAGDGPRSLQTRFLDEDIPFGAVTIEAFAQVAATRASTHHSCIDIFESLLKRDFRLENEMLNELNLLGKTKLEVVRLLSDGWHE